MPVTELHDFQLAVARRWRERAASVEDIYSQFFFLFAAFNALYFLWKEVDHLRGSHGHPSEREQINHLVAKLNDPDQLAITLRHELHYFASRRPIQRMDRRVTGATGTPDEGERLQQELSAEASGDRLRALAGIVYLIRCNLAHGSKTLSGDDEELVAQAVPILFSLVDASVQASG